METNNSIEQRTLNSLSNEFKEKLFALSEKFSQKFHQQPAFFARAPGRVNLIGEHIDYCGYSVLPMAIEHDILIAVSLNTNDELTLSNFEDGFQDFHSVVNNFSIDKSKPQWHDYFLSGFKGILDKFDLKNPQGMNVCVYGQVPKSAGLSSSSALVVCSALATLHANKLTLNKVELAELCAVSERYVGTQGGGMDQAISCLAECGAAKLIDFNPLKVTNVELPRGSQFVITNSCVEMNKAASNHFNTRVVECRLAAQVLAKLNGLNWRQIKKLVDLQTKLNVNLADMIKLTKKHLHVELYSLDEICNILDTNKEDIITNCLSQNTADLTEFQLYDRAIHVYSEAKRVYDFKETCSLTSKMPNEEVLKELGKLMNESHDSCRYLYECSCSQLDELTNVCRQAGAYGSRLTGAGWGGCAVSLIPETKLSQFLDQVNQNYYSKNVHLKSKFSQAAFATKPSSGIFIIVPN